MCGISGLFYPNNTVAPEQSVLREINRAQAHRGNDDEGYFFNNFIALGHRRLSIIDLAGGHQPIFNEDNSVVVVFNGEIFNYKQIAAELTALGHQFKTQSDTETIVHAWEEWGVDCLPRFRGMFAFILWDDNTKQLFVARDRLGVKPLYYSLFSDGSVGFASELKGLRAHPLFCRDLSNEAIEEYLAFGYVPDPRSIYQQTYKLEAGHYFLFDATQPADTAKPVCYWDLPWDADTASDDQQALSEALIKEFQQAVEIRLEAEVPLGAFLSGGVDSSAVVAFMAKAMADKPVTTCAIGFDVKNFDETDFAQLVADRYKTDHSVEIVDHNDLSLIDSLIDVFDEPYADSSALPTYKVCQMARKHVTVALSGDGGDELFAGYRRYKLHLAEERVRQKIPAFLRKVVFKPLGKLYPKLDWAPQFLRAKTTFQSLSMTTAEAFMNSMSKLRIDERNALYSPAFKQKLGRYNANAVYQRYLSAKQFSDPLKLIQYLDYKTWLVGDANTKVDRASMANGLEVRSPFMDHKFVEWAFTVPSQQNIKNGETKALLKKALEPYVNEENLYRQKMGFSVPLAEWLRGPLKDKLVDVMGSDAVKNSGIFNTSELNKKIQQHLSGKYDHSASLWTLFMLGLFLQNESKEVQ
ncbi:XrtA/PEP-CTERM system amidotransferase [Alteromonas lipolytica]|uniref:asparagine synthase (glutamine-hydrolyzing) n=1 Tax=Alteromonas lipolytica TaxID=1856405 RepID=A0A1E8FEY7_9ALTE|nr:XrtA/PEP-CTERM system amidotransferase [Alteromonas lipolytica]OFI34053.1 asparagine synthetase B [Alteromonas lipolytica]GGF65845.1 amidotransferase 1, exosortase A system-associated [Alteromonas lipolytica]